MALFLYKGYMPVRKTREKFIEGAVKIHGNKYNYDKVKYINDCTKIIIICKDHGEFKQTPNSHLCGKGCAKCSMKKKKQCQPHSKEQFVEKAIKIHGEKYNYDEVNYVHSGSKVIIICSIHGKFKQTPHSHVNGVGCPKCGRKKATKAQTKTTEQFIEDAVKKHGDKYDYSKTIYIKALEKVVITCKKHGDFNQVANEHLKGYGCVACAYDFLSDHHSMSLEEFMDKAKNKHGDRYDYSKVNYVGRMEEVIIVCPVHGDIKTAPVSHLTGSGCRECGIKARGDAQFKTTEEFIQESKIMHGNRYDYSKSIYAGISEFITITCSKHGDFEQKAGYHMSGAGCSKCNKISSGEQLCLEALEKQNINYKFQYKIKIDKKRMFSDFYLYTKDLIIEINGTQHYKPILAFNVNKEESEKRFKKQQIRDKKLYKYCKENNIGLVCINLTMFVNKKILKQLIKYMIKYIKKYKYSGLKLASKINKKLSYIEDEIKNDTSKYNRGKHKYRINLIKNFENIK